MGLSSKLLLDATGTQGSELDSIYSLNDRGRKFIRNTSTVRYMCGGAGDRSTGPVELVSNASDMTEFCSLQHLVKKVLTLLRFSVHSCFTGPHQPKTRGIPLLAHVAELTEMYSSL